MNNIELNDLLFQALEADKQPSARLNEKILEQNQRIQEGKRLKYRRMILFTKIVAACIAISILIPTTIYAAKHFLNAKEATQVVGDEKLSKQFQETSQNSAVIQMDQTETFTPYQVKVLGAVSGKNISDFVGKGVNGYDQEKTYIVTAIAKTDGTQMTYDDELLVTPFIQGVSPMDFNIFYMGGGASSRLTDGVLYRLIECDSLEIFADKTIYLGVTQESDFGMAYHYDETTGIVSKNEDYQGMNMLFTIPLDKSKADAGKAAEYLEQMKKNAEESTEETGVEEDYYQTAAEVLQNCKMVERTTLTIPYNKETGCYEYAIETGLFWADENIPQFETSGIAKDYFWAGAQGDDVTMSYLLLHKEADSTITGSFYE